MTDAACNALSTPYQHLLHRPHLCRLWPLGGRLNLADSESLVVPVAFSEFIRRVKTDDVQSVFTDGSQLVFAVKPSSTLLQGVPEGSQATSITFSTLQPQDYSIPYGTMEANGVEFGAVNKRDNRMSTVMVRASCWRGLPRASFYCHELVFAVGNRGIGR